VISPVSRITRNIHSTIKRGFRKTLIVLGLIIMGPFVLLETYYQVKTRFFMEMPTPPINNTMTKYEMVCVWALFESRKPMQVEGFYPWDIMKILDEASVNRGTALTTYLAAMHLSNSNARSNMTTHHINMTLISVWLSRNWSTKQITLAVRDSLRDGNMNGVKDISRNMYKKELEELNPLEIATVFASADSRSNTQFREYRRRIMAFMGDCELIDNDQLKTYMLNNAH
jgi:hypothetical protein